MKNSFYVIKLGENFQLRFKEEDLLLSTASSLDGILHNLETIVGRYKNLPTIKKCIRKMHKEYKPTLEGEYKDKVLLSKKEQEEVYNDLVTSTIEKVLKEIPKPIPLSTQNKQKVKLIKKSTEETLPTSFTDKKDTPTIQPPKFGVKKPLMKKVVLHSL